MDPAASQTAHGPADPVARWVAELPPAPFVDSSGGVGHGRFVPLSPRVAVLIVAAIVARSPALDGA